MTAPTPSATTPQIEIPVVRHRVVLTENLRLDDPALAQSVTEDTFQVLSRWVKDLIGVDISPSTLQTLLANLPVVGSVFSAFDVVDDIKTLATYNPAVKKWGYETLPPWIETGLDVMGILPLPPIKQASMGLKTVVKMSFDPKYVFAHAKDAGASFITGSTLELLDDVAEKHLKAWQPKLIQGVGQVIDGTIKTVDVVARMPQARAISSVYTFVTRKKDPAEEFKDLLSDVNKAGKVRIEEVVETLIPLIRTFVRQHKTAHRAVPKSDQSKLKPKAENESRTKHRNGAPHQTNEHPVSQTPAATTKARTNGQQNPTAARDCKSCKTANPVNLATGEEILYQTDFATPGLMPVSWTRCYRSSHAPYDDGLLGARWTSAYTTAITQTAQGLVYHDPTGRNVRLPLLGIGESHDNLAEAFTLVRTSATEIVIAYRNGDSDVFRASGTTGSDGFGNTGLRYTLCSKRTAAGVELSILSLQETRNRFRDHPAIKRLAADTLLVVTDGNQLWLECRPASAENFVAQSPAAKQAVSDLAALHTANQKAGIAEITGDATLHPSAYASQLARRIGRIEQLLSDGSRHVHARYRYAPAVDAQGMLLGPQAGLELVEQLDAEAQVRTYAYHAHLLTRYTDYNGFGQNLTWQHNPAWAPFATRCIRTVADNGTEDTHLAYDTWFNETTLTDAAGVKSIYTYNADNLVTGIATINADGSQDFQQRVWDKNGNLTKEIDPEGRTTTYRYDQQGNLLSVVQPNGATTKYEYDAQNNPIKIIDPAGKAWTRSFDAQGNLTAQTNPAGQTQAYTYNALGQLIAVKDAKGGARTLAYNDLGQVVAITDCSKKTTRLGYNQLGHLVTSTDAANHVTRYDTDKLGRVIATTYPDGSKEHYQYDANDNLITVTDAQGRTTRHAYNPQGQLTRRTDANGNSLAYQYNANLQLLKLINQNGDTYDFRYDQQGRLIEEVGFDGKSTRYRYDLGGQLIESSSGKTTTEYERDDVGQLLTKRVTQQTRNGPVTQLTRYQYDPLGHLLWVRSPDSELHFTYDDAGHLISETQHVKLKQGRQTLERVFTLQHEVDELGNRIATTLPNGRRIDIQRYGSGHWIGTLWNGTPLVDLERDDLHRETLRQFGRITPQRRERLTQTRRYDALSRLTSLNLTTRGGTLASRQLTYDASGNLTQVQDWHRDVLRYDYDPVGQLLQATQPNLVETFAFDPAGNLVDTAPTKSTFANTAGKDHAQWEQGLDHLIEQPEPGTKGPQVAPVTRNLLKHYLGMTFDYDDEGNTIKKIVKGNAQQQPATLTLHYDAENRLIKAVKPQGEQVMEAEYRYDAFSRRIAKVVKTLQQAKATGTYGGSDRVETIREEITLFVWDGDTLIQEIQPDTTITYLYEPDSFVPLAQVHSDTLDSEYDPEQRQRRNEQTQSEQRKKEQQAEHLAWLKVTDKAAYEEQVSVLAEQEDAERQDQLTQLVTQAQQDRIYYCNTDQLGTPQEMVNEDGNVVWLARYKAWGRVHHLEKAEITQPLRFQGQYEDAETGLYYNRHRYYDPDAARYVTQDPIGLIGGTNTYSYAPNPIAWLDPRGLARSGSGGGEKGNNKAAVACPKSCNSPCAGIDPVASAQAQQGPANAPYVGVDSYEKAVLKKGTILYSLYPGGTPGFATSLSTRVQAKGDPAKYHDLTQVTPGLDGNGNLRAQRQTVRAYYVKEDICVAKGRALANSTFQGVNDSNRYKGGGVQYYVPPSERSKLSPGVIKPI